MAIDDNRSKLIIKAMAEGWYTAALGDVKYLLTLVRLLHEEIEERAEEEECLVARINLLESDIRKARGVS